jgi:hypothetical protein
VQRSAPDAILRIRLEPPLVVASAFGPESFQDAALQRGPERHDSRRRASPCRRPFQPALLERLGAVGFCAPREPAQNKGGVIGVFVLGIDLDPLALALDYGV